MGNYFSKFKLLYACMLTIEEAHWRQTEACNFVTFVAKNSETGPTV